MLSNLKFRIKRDLNDAISKFSYYSYSVLNPLSKDTKYKNLSDIIDDVLENDIVIANIQDIFKLDNYTFIHSVNTAAFSYILGASLKMYGQDLYDLFVNSLLHDIGKIFVRKEVLNKFGKLTNEEYEEVKHHASMGYEYLRKGYNLPESQCIGSLEHHERFDGMGYPMCKVGNDISIIGKIICISDVYDALTADRPSEMQCLHRRLWSI